MHSPLPVALFCGLLAGLLPLRAEAQNLTVQQPVFGVNSVGTTVSVPDRGSALLGGVGSAGASRSRYGFGPFRPGSTSGQFSSASSSSVSVTIHDFAEMDRYLNSQPGPAAAGHEAHLTGHAVDAWWSLQARSARTGAVSASSPAAAGSRAPAAAGSRSGVEIEAVSTAHRSLELGRAALERGSRNVARMHFRMAARRGSQAARDELARLKPASSSRNVAGTAAASRP